MNTSWHSYPRVFALGHRAIADLFLDEVLVEEKIDGSQFSFGRFEGELKCRSKGAQINADFPEKMFLKGVETARALDLHDGWTYRGEFLGSPKHNTLAYDRVPNHNVILFDVNVGEEEYLTYAEKAAEASRLGLEFVPQLFFGRVDDPNTLLAFLETPSILGGQKVEGIVVKNYKRFGEDKKCLMGKYVSEAFKETHSMEWKLNNPTNGDVVQRIVASLKTAARWSKAVQHLKDRGELTQSPKDIGALIKEVQKDVSEECEEIIKDKLFQHAIGHIRRGVTGGLPEWYKQELLKQQFQV